MIRVYIESPYAGDVERNRRYLRACIADSLRRGEAPFASHGFYTEHLDDLDPEQRRQGMAAGFAWQAVADVVAVYYDLGISDGMSQGIARGTIGGPPIDYRLLGEHWDTEYHGEPEEGTPIGQCGCPMCGARLEVMHGDEPGHIGVLCRGRQ